MTRTLDYVPIQIAIKINLDAYLAYIVLCIAAVSLKFSSYYLFSNGWAEYSARRCLLLFLVVIFVDWLGSWKRFLQITTKFCMLICFIVWLSLYLLVVCNRFVLFSKTQHFLSCGRDFLVRRMEKQSVAMFSTVFSKKNTNFHLYLMLPCEG